MSDSFNTFDHLPPEHHAEAEIIWTRVPEYFKRLLDTDPAMTQTGKITSIWRRLQDGERVEMLCQPIFKANLTLLDTHTTVGTTARLWRAGHHFAGGANTSVLAYYDDGTLLWLDNHQDNTDFETFWQRENLKIDNPEEAVMFIMYTKFRYLPEPGRMKIVTRPEDIPHDFMDWIDKPHNRQMKLDYQQQVAQLAPKMSPPIIYTESGVRHYTFCVWLHVLGQVFSFDCTLDFNGKWTFNAIMLGASFGDVFMPR